MTGSVVSVVGSVGAGKSTLLAAVVGDLVPSLGTVKTTAGPVGYVPQRAFILSGTVRENILFGRELHQPTLE